MLIKYFFSLSFEREKVFKEGIRPHVINSLFNNKARLPAKLLADIFDWKVAEGNLYEKELIIREKGSVK